MCVYVCIYVYNASLSKKEILSFVRTWMNLEDIRLNEISQTQKEKCYMISLICGKENEFIEAESGMVVSRGEEVEKMGRWWPKGIKLQLCRMNEF